MVNTRSNTGTGKKGRKGEMEFQESVGSQIGNLGTRGKVKHLSEAYGQGTPGLEYTSPSNPFKLSNTVFNFAKWTLRARTKIPPNLG